jgi:dTMP kinase
MDISSMLRRCSPSTATHHGRSNASGVIPVLVAFEGIDGSGKTTISNLVVERLQSRGLSVKHLRAEGKFASAVSEAIRTLARDSRNLDLVPRAEFLLYVARDVQLIEEHLREALVSHDVVLADRFLHTAEVLGRFGRHLPVDYIQPILRAASGGLTPDLVVLVDVDPVLARARRKASKLTAHDQRPPSRKGLSGVGLTYRLRRGYLELAAQAPERWVVVNNDTRLEAAVSQVTELIACAVRQGSRAGIAQFQAMVTSGAEARPRSTAGAPRSPEAALDALLHWLNERAESEPQVAAYVLSGLSGEPVDALRCRLAKRVPEVVLAGLSGLADDTSWDLRAALVESFPSDVARTLVGAAALDSRALALRPKMLPRAAAELVRTLARLEEDHAWELRDSLEHVCPDAVMSSLAGIDSSRAWSMRERWLERHHAALRDDEELARSAAKSVQGIQGDEAWRLRALARPASPLSCLGSLSGLQCERSFAEREHYLSRAPKLVMQTIRSLRHPRAWQMRRAVAMDTKEALDSITGLADPEAWELREQYADLWPSTVVKTLGPLADTERGRALLRRQLDRHGGNVSLLKHAASIALGNHHFTPMEI